MREGNQSNWFREAIAERPSLATSYYAHLVPAWSEAIDGRPI
jgi:hypothetical protein